MRLVKVKAKKGVILTCVTSVVVILALCSSLATATSTISHTQKLSSLGEPLAENSTLTTDHYRPQPVYSASIFETEFSEETSDEDSGSDEDDEDEEEEEESNSFTMTLPVPSLSQQTPVPQIAKEEVNTIPFPISEQVGPDSSSSNLTSLNPPIVPLGIISPVNETSIEAQVSEVIVAPPMAVRQKDEPDYFMPDENEDHLLDILQNAVRETYLAFRGNTAKKKKEELQELEDNLKSQIQNLDIDLNAKIMAIDTNSNSRISTLTEQIVSQRKEDILTFSDNLNQISKANQVHLETLHSDTHHLKVTVESLNKGQASLSAKMSQLQKTIHSLESKINEITIKNTEDFALVQTTQKTLAVLVDSMEKDLRAAEQGITNIQGKISDLEKAKTEDSNKLRKTLIREQKQDPMQTCVRHIRNKNVGGALKQWRMIEQIAEDLKDTLPADMTKVIEDGYSKSPLNLPQMVEFIHRAVSHGERRLKEAAYSTLLNKMDQAKHLNDRRRILEVFNVAQHMKSDLGSYYNTSSSTAEIISKLPEAVRLVTFEKVKLFLPSRGYLRVSADRKVSLVPQDARFYDKDEILWLFEYDKDKTDGTFYIKSDKLQKYLVTIHEGFNSYGFSRQALFMTGNRKENGTRFDISNINGDHILLKSIFYNGYLTWKSNIQTIYGDDDSYFVLLEDRKNGPSPYWIIEQENEFAM